MASGLRRFSSLQQQQQQLIPTIDADWTNTGHVITVQTPGTNQPKKKNPKKPKSLAAVQTTIIGPI